MSDAVPGSVFYGDPFPIYDGSGTGTLVSGLLNAAFTKQAYLNGATNAATVTVTEIGSSGWYEPSFTPSSAGRWAATITHASYGTWLVEDVECASSSDPAILGSGTLQSSSVLDATASSDDQAYRGALLIPTGGTGVGQGGKLIATYNGTTKAFATYANFGTSLDNTTTYVILAVSDYSRYVGDVVGAVTSLAPGAITGSSISAGAITSTKFGTGAITSTVLADDAITAAKIAADAIGASELAADAVTEIAAAISVPTANQNADALLDRVGAIDGYTPREAGALSLAALAGRDVGTLANPQYEAVDGSVVRLDATVVGGIRTAVTRDAT